MPALGAGKGALGNSRKPGIDVANQGDRIPTNVRDGVGNKRNHQCSPLVFTPVTLQEYTSGVREIERELSLRPSPPVLCQPELGARKEFRYRSAALSAINEGLFSSINSINKFT